MDRRELATLVNRIFGRMTFVHGFVHCDPHPGNLLVDSNGRVVLLDHGVYRSLDDDTRRTWCKLWRGLIANDDAEMRAAVADLGVDPELTTFFRIVLALVPARVVEDVHGTSTSAVISPGGGGGTTGGTGSVDGGRDVQVAARSGNPNPNNPKPSLAGFSGGVDKLSSFGKREVMRDVLGVKVERQTELFETLPRDLLMILKANNLLRYVNEQLDSPVNRFRSIAAAAEEGIAAPSDRGGGDPGTQSARPKRGRSTNLRRPVLLGVELRRAGGRDAPAASTGDDEGEARVRDVETGPGRGQGGDAGRETRGGFESGERRRHSRRRRTGDDLDATRDAMRC